MAKVVVFGTGLGAGTAHRYLSRDSEHEVCAFTVEKSYLKATEFRSLPVVEFESIVEKYPPSEFKMFVPLGSNNMNQLRFEKYSACKEKGYQLISYVSSTIQFRDELQIGDNCFILENNSINFDVKIGNNVTIWSSKQIGDRSEIGDNCWISSHVTIAGDVKIMPFTFIGISATISNEVTVAEHNFIGATALISKSTAPKDVYVVSQTPKAAFPSDKFMKMLNRTL